MFSAQLQSSGFRKLPKIRSQIKCTHFWNFSISSPSNGAHFSISDPHNAEDSKNDYHTPSEGACGCSLACILRRVNFKYEWSYTTTSPCAFKVCTATNLTDFSYEMFMQICRFIQTYSERWLKGWSPARQEITHTPCSLRCHGHEGRGNLVHNTIQTCSVLFYDNYTSGSDFCEPKVRGRQVKTHWPIIHYTYNSAHFQGHCPVP